MMNFLPIAGHAASPWELGWVAVAAIVSAAALVFLAVNAWQNRNQLKLLEKEHALRQRPWVMLEAFSLDDSPGEQTATFKNFSVVPARVSAPNIGVYKNDGSVVGTDISEPTFMAAGDILILRTFIPLPPGPDDYPEVFSLVYELSYGGIADTEPRFFTRSSAQLMAMNGAALQMVSFNNTEVT